MMGSLLDGDGDAAGQAATVAEQEPGAPPPLNRM